MIITGGSCKGRKINTVKSNEVRPTSSKIRESIFNMIQSSITDSVMLDLFAGSGIVGLEALSRGAIKVVYNEKNSKVFKLLKENLSNFDFDYELSFNDALVFLDKIKNRKFDIIFLDPPYAAGIIEPAITKIKENSLLEEDGLLVIEHGAAIFIKDCIETLGYKILKEKKYGDTLITIITL